MSKNIIFYPMEEPMVPMFSVRYAQIKASPNNRRTVGSGVFCWVISEAKALDPSRRIVSNNLAYYIIVQN
jgi:hypothetical protein